MNFDKRLDLLKSNRSITPVRLGMSRNDRNALFGEPDDTGQGFRRAAAPMILVYGGVEFHSGPNKDDGLDCIYKDNEEGVIEICLRQGDRV